MPIPVFPSGKADIDGVLWGSKWSFTNLTYSFPTTPADWAYSAGIFGFQAFNASQIAAATRALNNVDAVCGLSLTRTFAPGAGNLRFGEVTQVNYFNGDGPHSPGLGSGTAEGIPPDDDFPSYTQGDMWFSHNKYEQGRIGQFQFAAGILHELGHAVGLKHGHITQSSNSTGFNITYPKLPTNHDSQEYSVMTYNVFPGGRPNGSFLNLDYPTTLMQDDIAALQYLYGADYGFRAGNNVYHWSPVNGQQFVNGIGQGLPFHNKIFMTVWDGGGVDTYNFSNYHTSVTVNLAPGQWSTPSGAQKANLGANHFARGCVANALLANNDPRSLIENANGGTAGDILNGNFVTNVLRGQGGNDKINGGPGNDVLIGGPGFDSFIFSTAFNVGANVDRILDFNPAQDTIRLENAVFTAFGFSNHAISAAQFHTGAAAHDANDRIIYTASTGVVTYDANGNASGGAIQIAVLRPGLHVTAADFFII